MVVARSNNIISSISLNEELNIVPLNSNAKGD
jgi:hypothetical protein